MPSRTGSKSSTNGRGSSREQQQQQGSSNDAGGLRSQKTARGALLTNSLPMLQNLIKRAPDSYHDEFLAQWARFASLTSIVQLGAAAGAGAGGGAAGGSLAQARADEESFRQVTNFVCQVAHLYPKQTASLPSTLTSLLLSSAPTANLDGAATSSAASSTLSHAGLTATGGMHLAPDTRKTLMQGLVLLRRRNVITSLDLLKVLFPLLSLTNSPNLRTFVLKTILGDIKEANRKAANHKLNRTIQALLFGMIDKGLGSDSVGTGLKHGRRYGGGAPVAGGREAMWAVKIATELWRKHIWRDTKTVQLVATACCHPDTKVQSAAMHFFLVTPEDAAALDDSDENDDDEGPDIHQVKHRQEINKKRKSSERRAKKDIKEANRRRRKREQDVVNGPGNGAANFSALELLNDPEDFGERLYELLVRFDRAFNLEHKVLVMQLFGRVSGMHRLTTALGFYSYMLKYLAPHQLQVTSILVALAQSVHDLVPPDDLLPCVRKLAHEFVHPGVSSEVHAAGLNAIRELCRRQPLAMERDLLEDLVEYRTSKDKGVMMASRGLLQLYRDVNPAMLRRRERGKYASTHDVRGRKYGETLAPASGIAGIELLARHLKENEAAAGDDDGDEAGWDNWDVESDASDDSGGWINVNGQSDDDIDVSDSSSSDDDDDAEKRTTSSKRRKTKRGPQSSSSSSEEEDDSESGEGSEDDAEDDAKALSELAMTKLLTPADFAKLNELRLAQADEDSKRSGGGSSALRRKIAELQTSADDASQALVSEREIMGVRKKAKMTHEERMASIQEGREGREKFGSNKHRKLSEKAHSTTNEEKRRKKAFAMVAASRSVRSKKSASLVEKSKRLRGHIDRQKKGGRRGHKK